MNRFKKITNAIYDRSIDINERLSSLFIWLGVFAAILGFVVCVYAHVSPMGLFICSLIPTITPLIMVVSNKLKKPLVGRIMMAIGVSLAMPLMWIYSGGINSGVNVWFVYELYFISLSFSGWAMVIALIFASIPQIGCFIFGYYYPQNISFLTTDGDVYVSVAGSIGVVAVAIILTTMYQKNIYVNEKILADKKERELEKANVAQKNFLANMSHEIRSPINGILGMNEMMLRSDDINEIKEYAANIRDAGQALLSIVNDILDFSKIESGNMVLTPVEYSVRELLDDCYNMIFLRANEKELEFKINAAPDMPSVLYGDNIRIRQIIVNMLTNAVKYTNEGFFELYISTRKIDDEKVSLLVDVKDTGIGISEDNLKNLFTKFNRLDDNKIRGIEGTGLGLSITKSLVELMKGEMHVDSILGQGSTFSFEITQNVSDWKALGKYVAGENKTQEKKYSAKFTAPNAKILIVDDIALNLTVMKGLLKETKIQIDTAIRGADAIEKVKASEYDIIFMDHMMPEMDGIETFHHIRSLGGYNKKVPVIMLTANAISGVEEEYKQEGFTDYLSKPVSSNLLEEKIIKYLPQNKLVLADDNK